MAPPRVENPFRSLDLGSIPGGECFFRVGGRRDGVVGAPHEGYDLYTSHLLQDYVKAHPETPAAYCEGFRKKDQYDVNRPTGKDPGLAPAVMRKYQAHLWAANGGDVPTVVHEIHGKGDRQHPFTEITLIGKGEKCGWNKALREKIKRQWEGSLREKVVVYGVDPKAYYGHTEYQAEGLAGIHGWCGVNIEFSKQTRDLWSDERRGDVNYSPQRAAVLNTLGALLLFVETVIQTQKNKP